MTRRPPALPARPTTTGSDVRGISSPGQSASALIADGSGVAVYTARPSSPSAPAAHAAIDSSEPVMLGIRTSAVRSAGLPPAIPPGFRALSVRVNEVIGVAGYVLPGTHVDVVVTLNPTSDQLNVTSKVILTNVLVLAAGTQIDRETDKDKPTPVSVVTLLVDPDQSERLTLAASEGKIQLALRNPRDRATPSTPGVRAAALLGPAPAPRASSRPRAPQAVTAAVAAPVEPIPVEIIRGDKRAREIVRQEQQ